MQFPVPQFTDVEDKIIGQLGIKQFGIVFGAGVVIFLLYSATKSMLVLIVAFLVFGLPALVLAFGKINGRPIYIAIPMLVQYLIKPKDLVFHKEMNDFSSNPVKLKDMEVKEDLEEEGLEKQGPSDPQARLLKINRLLQEQSSEESKLAKQLR